MRFAGLERTVFYGANLKMAIFYRGHLKAANFTLASLKRATFKGVHLEEAVFDRDRGDRGEIEDSSRTPFRRGRREKEREPFSDRKY